MQKPKQKDTGGILKSQKILFEMEPFFFRYFLDNILKEKKSQTKHFKLT